MTNASPVTIVVAVSRNGVIGVTDARGRQRLPWRIKSDLKHFKAVTSGGSVLMGRRTFETLASEGAPNGLPNRLNVVISRSLLAGEGTLPAGVLLASSLTDAIDLARASAPERAVFVIGGGEIYREALRTPIVNHIEITDVQADVHASGGETVTYFAAEPLWSNTASAREALGWRLVNERAIPASPEAGDEHACIFRTYARA